MGSKTEVYAPVSNIPFNHPVHSFLFDLILLIKSNSAFFH